MPRDLAQRSDRMFAPGVVANGKPARLSLGGKER
jgi:hypothetical protein